MSEDFEIKVTSKRQAEVDVTLGPAEYRLKGEVEEGRAPYVGVYSGTLRLEIREGDWPAFRDAVDKLFAVLRGREGNV